VPGLKGDQLRSLAAARRANPILRHKSGKARIATALPIGSRETFHSSDNRHSASSAKNSDENWVAAIQRKAKTKTREQGKSDQLP
jgi:hypothetical protein